MSEQLKHIFEVSKCPTKRQMQDYLKGTMEPEEIYALEHHISSCLLCSEALDGMMEHQEEALVGLNELNNTFLKDHLELHPPHIHLNSITATAAATGDTKQGTSHYWKPIGIAATLLLCLGLGWYFKNSSVQLSQQAPVIAQATPETDNAPKPSASSTVASGDVVGEQKVEVQSAPLLQKEVVNSPMAASPSAQPLTEREMVMEDIQSASQEKVVVLKKATANRDEAASATTSEETVKQPAIITNDVAALSGGTYQQKNEKEISISGARSSGTSYVVDGVASNRERAKEESSEKDADDAETLYKNENYSKALAVYRKQMNSENPRIRDNAKLMAARCYLNLNDKSKAESILNDLITHGNGTEKRQAKKLLKQLQEQAVDGEK